MLTENAVSVTVPVRDFGNVARLVTGGFISRLPLGFEAVDDLQLAVELVLRSLPVDGDQATVTLAAHPDDLTVSIGPYEEQAIQRYLEDGVFEGIGLGTFLARLVDGVEVAESPERSILLHKKLEAHSL